MRIRGELVEGRLLRRYKRFLADVELDDGEVRTVHCANPGRLIGCKEAGSRVLLRDSENPRRKLRWTWHAVRVGRSWVGVDTALPNHVVREAIEAGRVPELSGYDELKAEVPYGENSRVDLLLSRGEERAWVEVKCTTMARGRVALFPDAVTARGLKHLGELSARVAAGERAVQFFLVARPDVERFRAADDIDPAYGAGLRAAARSGVEVLAYASRVHRTGWDIGRPLEVDLSD